MHSAVVVSLRKPYSQFTHQATIVYYITPEPQQIGDLIKGTKVCNAVGEETHLIQMMLTTDPSAN